MSLTCVPWRKRYPSLFQNMPEKMRVKKCLLAPACQKAEPAFSLNVSYHVSKTGFDIFRRIGEEDHEFGHSLKVGRFFASLARR